MSTMKICRNVTKLKKYRMQQLMKVHETESLAKYSRFKMQVKKVKCIDGAIQGVLNESFKRKFFEKLITNF